MTNLFSAISYKAPEFISNRYLTTKDIQYLVLVKDYPSKIFLTNTILKDVNNLLNKLLSGNFIIHRKTQQNTF